MAPNSDQSDEQAPRKERSLGFESDDDEDDDPENSDERCRERFNAMFWHPTRDAAVDRMLASAQQMTLKVKRQIIESTEKVEIGERFAAIVSCLAQMLEAPKPPARRAAARLLYDGFASLTRRGTLFLGSANPDIDRALTVMVGALNVPDSETRLILLRTLACMAHRPSFPALPPAIISRLFEDRLQKVVIQALTVVMTTGVDRASVAISGIIGLLSHVDMGVRLAACEALAEFGDEAKTATTELVRLIQFDDELRERAILTLIAVADVRQISKQLSTEAEREALLSCLRAAGPGARNLRVRLQARWSRESPTPGGAPPAQGPAENDKYAHSDDFRSVLWFGQRYTFSAKQAACVKVLWEHWVNKTPEVGGDYLLEAAEAAAVRMSLIFRDHPAWNTMIVAVPKMKNLYRLNPPFDS